ncbi:MAG: nucleotide-binding protein [Methanoregula sp.]|nr:nucleotide-binding protein [Methanoregula sp.]
MDYSEAAERISRKFATGTQTPDVKKIEGKLKRLVEEFNVKPAEAERSVTSELAKEFNLPVPGPGSGGKSGGTEEKKIADAVPGEWVTLEGKIVALSAPASPSIAQNGVIADESGAIRFVVWAKSNAPVMADGSWYRIESAVVDEYKGVANLKIHSGTTIKEITEDRSLIPTPTPIRDLHPGIGGIRAKFVQEWDASHERMLQSGLLGDETGTIKFVIWKEPGKERLVPGAVYNIFYAQVDEFNGRLSLNLNASTILQEEGEIEVSGGEATVTGAFVHIAPGSGIIKRCPVEGCNRALSRQNYCPVHEIQPKFVYDLRVKGWLDDGEKTHNILIQRDVVEVLTGISLAQAQEIAENNPLGMDEVFIQMRDKMLGRYITCQGRQIDNRVLVNKCENVTFSSAEHTALLNRAGGAPS